MLTPKKKITKREIKEDRLVTTYFEAQNWFEENKRKVSTALVLVGVLAAVGWIYVSNKSTANLDATAALGKVMKFYDDGRYEVAINGAPQENIAGLRQIVDDYGNTESGEIAKLYLGNCYYMMGEYDKALEVYRDADISGKTLRSSVYAGTAACLEAKGSYAEAGEYFERAASTDDQHLLAAENLYHAARNCNLAGQKERAVELLNRLKKEYPLSSYARDADLLLAQANS